jgi:hypothetical protein
LEKKDYRIKCISVARTDSIQGFKGNFELDPVVKSYKIVDDSVINQDVYIFIWTNDNATYSLKLKKKDWSKDTVFKCRHLVNNSSILLDAVCLCHNFSLSSSISFLPVSISAFNFSSLNSFSSFNVSRCAFNVAMRSLTCLEVDFAASFLRIMIFS